MSTSLADIAARLQGYDPKSLNVETARAFIQHLVRAVPDVEICEIRNSLGRILAQDIISPINVPAHDNSAMDGYALSAADFALAAQDGLEIVGVRLAGAPNHLTVGSGQCVRITTGAVMPEGLDTVVPQEFCIVVGQRVLVPQGVVQKGDNRRLKGEDLAVDVPALRAGRVLTPADLGIMASLAVNGVPVFKRVRVALFSTGDELRSLGEALDPGSVYDSNRYTLWGMLKRLDVDIIDLGVIKDNPDSLRAAFMEAADKADAIITSGGVSVGEADHTKRIMSELGDVVFWRIAMRPGRPMTVGKICGELGRESVVFGLPGNPVAVMITFYAFVREALLAMSGASPRPLPSVRARSIEALRKKPGRTEYQRGKLRRREDGDWEVSLTGSQGSGVLRSMSEADGLVVLHHAQGDVSIGDWVDVLPFDGLV